VADAVRVIEYQVLPWADLDGMGDLPVRLKSTMGESPHVGILRCVTQGGRKVTFAGDANATNLLVKTGEASNPAGALIAKREFPVMMEGWPFRTAAAR
jgi:hypothetical protein